MHAVKPLPQSLLGPPSRPFCCKRNVQGLSAAVAAVYPTDPSLALGHNVMGEATSALALAQPHSLGPRGEGGEGKVYTCPWGTIYSGAIYVGGNNFARDSPQSSTYSPKVQRQVKRNGKDKLQFLPCIATLSVPVLCLYITLYMVKYYCVFDCGKI